MSSRKARETLVLTGASRGIGHATVKRFSDEQWRIITCSCEEGFASVFQLCSSDFGYVTGTEVFVTGGQHLY
ncbi:hypothetical protein [Limibacillus halophilus]|uniref:Short chain dehydrogenase n=1 Tax=Limibacillus halophilus TaxID=1579333 RepID=A0A839SRZ8_9PROT|nr:hypothetical protein [Limibacillus halophilus]